MCRGGARAMRAVVQHPTDDVGTQQPKTYPHPPIPAARLFFVFLRVFSVFFHLGKS